jgi:predicted nucleic acid-binding Zn ribbon protein
MRLSETMSIALVGWSILRLVPNGNVSQPRGTCEGCSQSLWSDGAYRVPGLRGLYCSITCIETLLFGQEHCRWCGAAMEKPYVGIGSRVCSEECGENYNAHVLGDRSAALGSGKRLLLWLQREQPDSYRKLIGQSVPSGRLCQNPDCKRGESGQPASLAHLRKGSRFCSEECRKHVHRNGGSKEILNRDFDPSGTRILRGFSRPHLDKMDPMAYPLFSTGSRRTKP